jgi:hypothetical protein
MALNLGQPRPAGSPDLTLVLLFLKLTHVKNFMFGTCLEPPVSGLYVPLGIIIPGSALIRLITISEKCRLPQFTVFSFFAIPA